MASQRGVLRKLRTAKGRPVAYELPLGDKRAPLNELIGRRIQLEHPGEIYCIACGRKTKKSFAQGYCYPCFQNSPECDPCILRPELCRAHEGEARDLEWARGHCLQPHVVYLALSSAIKVGVTRKSQVPTRWMDQGAVAAIHLAETPNRHTAGLLEVALKAHLPDKTDWRKMLKNEIPEDADLKACKREISALVPEELRQWLVSSDRVQHFAYPVREYPAKIRSLSFDKEARIEGELVGIKGQYLILDGGRAFNVRKHQGYVADFSA